MSYGQMGIVFRTALLRGDAAGAARAAAELDVPHRVELLLGGALRDAREDFISSRLYLDLAGPTSEAGLGETAVEAEGRWFPLTSRLVDPAVDMHLDTLAAGYVAGRRVPERWVPERSSPERSSPEQAPPEQATGPDTFRVLRVPGWWRGVDFPEVIVAAALQAGRGGRAVLDTFAEALPFGAVDHYYRVGTIHALGPRPLLALSAWAGEQRRRA